MWTKKIFSTSLNHHQHPELLMQGRTHPWIHVVDMVLNLRAVAEIEFPHLLLSRSGEPVLTMASVS